MNSSTFTRPIILAQLIEQNTSRLEQQQPHAAYYRMNISLARQGYLNSATFCLHFLWHDIKKYSRITINYQKTTTAINKYLLFLRTSALPLTLSPCVRICPLQSDPLLCVDVLYVQPLCVLKLQRSGLVRVTVQW